MLLTLVALVALVMLVMLLVLQESWIWGGKRSTLQHRQGRQNQARARVRAAMHVPLGVKAEA
jgi:hypothetical protein